MLSPRSVEPIFNLSRCLVHVRLASRHARRANRDKLSNWHRPSGTLPPTAGGPANSQYVIVLAAPFYLWDASADWQRMNERPTAVWLLSLSLSLSHSLCVSSAWEFRFHLRPDGLKVQRCTCTTLPRFRAEMSPFSRWKSSTVAWLPRRTRKPTGNSRDPRAWSRDFEFAHSGMKFAFVQFRSGEMPRSNATFGVFNGSGISFYFFFFSVFFFLFMTKLEIETWTFEMFLWLLDELN